MCTRIPNESSRNPLKIEIGQELLYKSLTTKRMNLGSLKEGQKAKFCINNKFMIFTELQELDPL